MAVRLLDADRIGAIAVFCDPMSIESVPRQKTQANGEYAQRINRVIDYLRGNLDRQVKLEELAKVACFSEFHFHRIFSAISGETLKNFTNRLRLEKAARLLRYSDQKLTDIALECGFSVYRPLFRVPSDPATTLRQVNFEKAARSKRARFAKNSSRKTNMVSP